MSNCHSINQCLITTCIDRVNLAGIPLQEPCFVDQGLCFFVGIVQTCQSLPEDKELKRKVFLKSLKEKYF
jgi:hypothetical protein